MIIFAFYMMKKIYCFAIIPYIFVLLYFMFIGFGREPFSQPIVRLSPIISTIEFIQKAKTLTHILINIIGNIVMFIPFGFLGWVFSKYQFFRVLILDFLTTLTIVEGLQYFTKLGVFDIDDFILNSFGVWIGFMIYKKITPMR